MNKLLDSLGPFLMLVGRLLIAALFVQSGLGKIGGYAGTQAYMQSAGVPGVLLPLVILIELGGGSAIIARLCTRVTAVVLAAFCILTAFLFHAGSSDQVQQIMFLKNIGLAGGFVFLSVNGAGWLSADGFRQRRR